MKYLITVLFISLLQSCFKSPTEMEEPVQLQQIWSYEHGIVGNPSPVILGGNIYAAGGLFIFGLDLETGQLIWQTQIDDDSELQGRQFLNLNNQIVANHVDIVRGWDTESGNLLWQFNFTEEYEARLLGTHTVTNNGYAFAARKSMVFLIDEEGTLTFEKVLDKKFGVQGVTFSNEKFFVAQKQTVNGALTLGRITVLSAQNGDSLWSYNTDNGGFTSVAPIIENNILYASTVGNSKTDVAAALNAETGEVIWEYESDYLFTQNSSLGPRYYYVNTGGSLAALNKENGQLEWRVEWMGTDFNKPVYLEGFLYHIRDFEMLIIDDSTGEVVHREPVPKGGGFFWHVAASSDKIFAQTSRQLIAYQPWHLRD